MRKFIIMIFLFIFLSIPVEAMDFTAPIPDGPAQKYIPDSSESFAEGLWDILKAVVSQLDPDLSEAAGICLSIVAVTVLASTVKGISDDAASPTELAAACMIGTVLLRSTGSLIKLGVETVTALSEYSKALLPVLTGALAAQGGLTTSASLYTGTTAFIGILTAMITNIVTPLIYALIAISVAGCALEINLLKELGKFIKWLMLWLLKLSIYIFTGYISITGVVSGTTDAAAIKATKLAMSGFVPVVGNIISDASEAVLHSASMMKNAAGIYGIWSTVAILVGPFLKVGTHYILLKLTSALCGAFGGGNVVALLRSFSSVMGYILGLIGSVSVMILIGVVCFMKGFA